jgi:hypothetical protein
MNIYVNGDSFSAGEELADIDLPGFPGYKTETSNFIKDLSDNEMKWSERKWMVGQNYYGTYENYVNAGKALAWPAALLKMDSNLFVKNSSKSSASMTGIANRTIADLLEYQSQGINFDRVFIQLTGCHRFEFYDSTDSQNKFVVDKTLGWVHTLRTETQRQLGKSYIAQYKDKDYAIKFLYALCTLKYAIKGLTGVDPIFLSSLVLFTKNVISPLVESENLTIKLLLKESGMLSIPDELYMETVHTQNNFLYMPINHFEYRTHLEYAKIIYDRYIKL